ncbi:MAG: T9SS C-terminal target domain-containing protein [Candidatus Kapaibacterium sp.]|nr:MAG: T9SS C-terminal target domain-containing protein [Candidatus Kapabacteria bacterium]
MVFRYLCALVFSLTAVSLHSQSRWTSQASPTREQLRGVSFVDERTGWAVGNKGTILATQNGGQSWTSQGRVLESNFLDVFFLNPRIGFATGADGLIATTLNGGTSWEIARLYRSRADGLFFHFSTVFFADSLRGWLAADSGAVLTTRDGGNQWTLQNTGVRSEVSSLYFINANVGWASAGGTILRTSNGGQTWVSQVSYSNASFNWIHFTDSTNGWAAGNSGVLVATNDGGRTWRQQQTNTAQGLAMVKFVNPRTGWVLGANGTILSTTDAGATWQSQASPVSTDILAASFTDSTRGWAVGSNGAILSYAPPEQRYSVAGRITLGEQGLANVVVSTATQTTRTDSLGRFTLGNLPSGRYTLAPSLQGFIFAPTSASVVVSNANISNVNFVASSLNTASMLAINGRIVQNGEGLGGITIAVRSSTGTLVQNQTSAPNGTFRALVPTTGTYMLIPTSDNFTFSPTSQTVRLTSTTLTISDFQATRSFAIRGRITRNAQAIQGQKITLLPDGRETLTDANGNYTFTRLTASRYRIVPNTRFDGSFTPRRADLLLSADIVRDFALNPVRQYRVSGTIRSLSGTVLRNAQVQITGTTFATTQTNLLGEYSFMLQSGAYKLAPRAEGYGFSPVELNITVADTAISNLDFTAGAVINGRILAESGQPVAGVSLETRAGSQRKRTTTDSAGYYQFSNLTTGTYTITPSRNRTAFNPPTITIDAPRTMAMMQMQETSFRAAQTAFSVLGTVLSRPSIITSSSSNLLSSAANVSVALLRDTAVLARAVTDSAGRYLFRNVPRGAAYRVAIASDEYIFPISQAMVVLTTADVRVAPFVGQKRSTILVQVQNSSVSNRGIGGVLVSIAGANTTNANATNVNTATGRTDSTGRFLFTNVSNGTYTITVRRAGFQPPSLVQTLTITETVTTTAVFALRQNGFDFSGQIVFNRSDSTAGTPLSEVDIAVTGTTTSGEAVSKNEKSDDDGQFLISDIQPGTYTFTVKRDGFVFRQLRDVSIPLLGRVFSFNGTSGTISLPNLGILGNSAYATFSQAFIPPVMLAFRTATSASTIAEGRLLRVKNQYEFDAGAGSAWKANNDGTFSLVGVPSTNANITTKDDGAISHAVQRIKLNKFLIIESPSLTINPESGVLQASQGRVLAENIPFAGKRGEFVLYDGALNMNLNDAANAGLAFVAKGVQNVSKIFGVAVKIDTLRFLGDVTNVRGIRVVGAVDLPGIFACGAAKTPVRIDNLDILRRGISFSGSVNNIGTPAICMTRLDAAYDSEEDRFNGRGTISMPFMPIGGATAAMEIIGGNVNQIHLSANTRITTPFGFITRLGGGIEGLASENFSVYLQGQMSSLIPNLWEVDVEQLRYTHPSLINFDAEVRAVYLPSFEWQGIGNLSIEMDWNKYVALDGRIRLGTLDEGQTYAIDGNTSMLYSWKPTTTFVGQVSGDVTIPEFGTREKRCGWNPFCHLKKTVSWFINKLGGLPRPLGYMDVLWENKLIKGQAGLGPRNLFTRKRIPQHFVMDFGRSFFDSDFFRTEAGLLELNKRLRPSRDGLATNFKAGEEPKIALVERSTSPNGKGSTSTTHIATTERIPIDNNIGIAVVSLQSPDIVPTSTLLSPSGKTYTRDGISEDVEYKESEEGVIAHWTLYEPEAGVWTLSVPEARDVDSLDVFAFPKERSFAIQARSLPNNTARVTWDTTNTATSANVSLYLDTDNQDLNGVFLGTVGERSGGYTFAMSDSLAACEYFVYAIRNENEIITTSYAAQPLANTKPTLAAPTRIMALPARDVPLQGFLAWQASTSTVNTSGYIVRVRNAEGRDSVYALTFGRQDTLTLRFAQAGRYQVRMAAFTDDGRQGCFGDTVGVTISNRITNVWQEQQAQADEQRQLISVSPNPANNMALFRLHLPQGGAVRLALFNTLGQRIATPLEENLPAGRHEISFDCASLPTGVYLYRCEYGNTVYTGKLSVVR